MATAITRKPPNATSSNPGTEPEMPGIPTITPIPASMRKMPRTVRQPRMTTPIARRLLGRLLRGRVRLDDDRRAVRHDLGHVAREGAAVEAHRDDRVRAHQRRVLDQPVERLAAGVLEQLGVLVDLAPAERAQAGDEVAGEAARSD